MKKQTRIEEKTPKTNFNFKRNSLIFFQLFRLIGKAFYKNVRGPLFTYIIPIFFTTIFYFLFSSNNSSNKGSTLLGYIALPCLTILTSLSASIVEWKNSIFLKRMDTTGISKKNFILCIWIFYFMVGWSGVVVELLAGMAIGREDVIDLYKTMNWWFFILAISLINLMSIGIATLLGGNLSDDGANQGISMIIYFICIFFSGVMLDPRLYETSDGIRIFSYFIPLKYPVALLLFSQIEDGDWSNAGFNTGRWDVTRQPEPKFQDFTDTWQPVVGAILIIIALFVITALTFKWHKKR
ncbi:ABC transporter permease [Spiroplasma helicoides]|uniref:ABC transporter permease n=1 Tax=Spiroplasma helicoides TaxID=216938 RepID=A0A1B3SLP1_9MOLU|nr:ABC transporter permease [Spiroplasma helicoides]AOG60852.1 ABC transporter permease [Spiroplasma helicoides]